jgi:hypothetical protein
MFIFFNGSPFGRYRGFDFGMMVDFLFYFNRIEIMQMTYPFIFKGCDDNGVFISI